MSHEHEHGQGDRTVCFFCQEEADAQICQTALRKQGSKPIARVCQDCVRRLNMLAHYFGNDLTGWYAETDKFREEAAAAQPEPSAFTEVTPELAVQAAMTLLKARYDKEHTVDNAINEPSAPTPGSAPASASQEEAPGPLIF